MPKNNLKLAVWICHIIVAVLSLLAIVSYFFLPFWSINLSYNVDAETLQKTIGDSVDFDAESVVGKDGVDLGISLEFKTWVLFKSYGKADAAVDALIEDNVAFLVEQLTDTLNSLIESAVRTVTSGIVQQKVHENVKNMLSGSNPDISDDEVTKKLNDIGITDEFISSKTDAIIDTIYNGGSTVDDVCDQVIDTVDEIFAKMVASDDLDLQNAVFTEEDKDSMRKIVKDTMENFASEDGVLDANELIASIFLQAIDAMTGSKGEAAAHNTALTMAAEEETGESASERLQKEVRKFLMNLIPASLNSIVAWVMRGMTILFFLSSFWWAYILLKLFVKVLRRKNPKIQKNPTIRLWTPIVFGWLPYLIFVGIPSVALRLLKNVFADKLPANMTSILNSAGVSFFSAGIVAAVAALILFGISIFYIVARRKFKKADKSASEAEGEGYQEAAPSSNPYYGNYTYDNYSYDNSAYGNYPYDNSAYDNSAYGNYPYDNSAYDNSAYGNYPYDNSAYDNSAYGNYPYDNSSSDDSNYNH